MLCTRRDFFAQFGRSLAADLAESMGTLRSELTDRIAMRVEQRPAPRSWLRPPGALPEAAFLQTCTRCTACQEVCPYESIRRIGPEFGAEAGTPAIIPDESPCYLCEDMPCITACEPKALRPVPRNEVDMGLAVIDPATCYVSQGQPCDYCVTRCPLRGTAIHFDQKGLPKVVDQRCAGCGVCAYLCPPNAIDIVSTG